MEVKLFFCGFIVVSGEIMVLVLVVWFWRMCLELLYFVVCFGFLGGRFRFFVYDVKCSWLVLEWMLFVLFLRFIF